MFKRWSTNLAAVVAWLLVMALGLVILAVGANLYQLFAVYTLQVTRYTSTITIQVYYVTVGLLWLGFLVWMEHFLVTTAPPKGLVWKRSLLVIGLEILVIALIQAGMMLYLPLDGWQIGLVLVEALLAGGLIFLSRRLKKAAPQGNPSNF